MAEISRKRQGRRHITAAGFFKYFILILLVLVYIFPLLWVVFVSLKENTEVMLDPWGIPEILHFENYASAWIAGGLGRATLNSAIVCTVTLAISILIGSMAAYAISVLRWKHSGKVLGMFLFGMMVPVHCILIPLFVVFVKIKLTDTYLSMILPYTAFALPTTIYLMCGFFKSIPYEVYESACMDGCSVYRLFLEIGMPLAKGGIFVAGLMTFVGNWNELLVAMVFTSSPEVQTIPVRLTAFVSPYATDYVRMFAAIVLAMLPTIVVYSMFSNRIVSGLTTGAVKG